MASFDLDPLFLKGLRLLHSKAKDSADQLRQLLEEVLSHKHSSTFVSTVRDSKGYLTAHRLEGDKNNGSKKGSPRHSNESSSQSSKSSLSDEPKRKEAEKRHFEKLNQELNDLFFEAKRPRILAESPRSSVSSSPSPQPVTIKIEEQSSSVNVPVKSELMDSIAMLAASASGGPTDAEDFAIEMGLVCIVCKQLEATSRNQLIECQECHSLYHQECHRPPVTDTEVNDPRHVWYCIRCTKTMRKASKTQKPSSKSGSTAVNLRETVISTKNPKTTDLPTPTTPSLLPFKRSELKTSGVTQSSSTSHGGSNLTSSKPTGLASLAVNFGNRAPIASTTISSTKTGFGSKGGGGGGGGLSSLANTSKLSSSFSSLAGSSQKSGGKAVPSGLVSLAASVSSKTSTAPPRSLTSTSASSGVSSAAIGGGGNGGNSGKSSSSTSSSLMSADKRLQIMKKKAAQKMQEKRRLSSK